MNHDTLEKILSYGVCAPSGDNSQPWSFSYNGLNLRVYAHPEKDHPILNVDNGGTYIACGALLENISIAASHFGFEAKIELTDPSNGQAEIAKITFSEKGNAKNDDDLFAYIKKRHTNRKTYNKKKKVSQEQIDTLFAPTVTGVTNIPITDDKSIQTLANDASKMEKIALETKQLHRLFFDDILFDNIKNNAGEPGLYIQTMELPLPVQLLFRILGNWKIMKFFLLIKFHFAAAATNGKLYASAPLLGAIFIQNTQSQEYIKAGMAFQKIWLVCTKYGLHLQPIVGISYLYKYVISQQSQKIISKQNVQLLSNIGSDFKKIFKRSDVPVMFFRVGYAQESTAISHRKPPVIEYTSR